MARPWTPRMEGVLSHTAQAADWAEGLRCNNARTLSALYTKHFPAVRSYVLQNNGSEDDARDVFQESIVVLWLGVKEGRVVPEADAGGFLFRVAKNKWLDVLRSAAHKHMKVVHDDRIAERIHEVDDLEERIVRLRRVYDKLDDKCRQVLDQFYYERKDLATIATGMGVEEESIRTIKYRCMMKLRAFRKAIRGEEERHG